MAGKNGSSIIKLCGDKILPPAKRAQAVRLALRENPKNLPSVQMAARPMAGAPRDGRARMALLTKMRWKPGRTLRVGFIGGHPKVRAKIEEVAREWMKYANIKLEFGDVAKAEIRIAFDESDGSWSYLGLEAQTIGKKEPTMNYGWLTPTTEIDEYHRVVLHEFGHALGCIHEHSHPKNGIPWDKPKVYAYYARTNGWSPEETDDQVFSRYSESETNFSEFDRKSIMLYAIPDSLTIGNYSVGWNMGLSTTDKKFIGTVYPGEIAKPVKLTTDGKPAKAAIGSHGEEDLFQFRVADTARFEVQTTGKTDLVLMLLGPDSETRRVAEDNDSGAGKNARVEQVLMPGEYYARVRHFSKKGTGSYQINVRRKAI